MIIIHRPTTTLVKSKQNSYDLQHVTCSEYSSTKLLQSENSGAWSQKHTCAHLNHKELVSLLPLLLLSYAHSNCLLWCWAGHHSKPIVLYSWFGSALVSTYQPTPEPLSLSLWFAPFLHSPRWTDFGHHNLQFLVYDDKKKPSSQLSAQNLDAVQYIKNKQH